MSICKFLIVVALGAVSTVAAANDFVAANKQRTVANAFLLNPEQEWNKLSRRDGKYQEIWTLDGDQLNKISFFGGVPGGQAIFKDRNSKTEPLPRVAGDMLLTDIPALLETTYRLYFKAGQMNITRQEVRNFAGRKAISFDYDFVRADDEVERRGTAVGMIVGQKLYLATFEAPTVYFFDRDVEKFRRITDTISIGR